MERTLYLLCGSLLLVTLHLQRSATHPVTEPDAELQSLRGVLEKLEDKLAVIEALERSPGVLETRSEDPPQIVTPEEREDPLPDTRATRNNPPPINDPLLKGLRSLQNRRMMRGSSCFGRRIDRIDALSGLGCNGFRRI
ncbi:natriuretic peptides A-like [Pseudophryne corroboree]|uniref:natriuretic peptides A-like n=1 Tax=Pseudophryne corroboree TaxID=495146 RepID=UPI0030819270